MILPGAFFDGARDGGDDGDNDGFVFNAPYMLRTYEFLNPQPITHIS